MAVIPVILSRTWVLRCPRSGAEVLGSQDVRAASDARGSATSPLRGEALRRHEPRPRHRHRRQLHAAQPHRRLRPRHRAVGGAGLGRRWPTPSSSPSSCPTSSAACSPKAPSRPPSCRCSRASCRTHGRDQALAFARQAHAALLLVLVPFSVAADHRHAAGVVALLAPGMRDDPPTFAMAVDVRPHRLSLSAVHLAGLALRRRAEQHRPLRPCRGDAHPAQPRPDRRRAGADAAAAQRRLCRRDRRGDRRPPAMAVAADRLRPRRRRHEAGAAALDASGWRAWSSSPRRSRSAAACSRSAPCSTWCGPRCCRPARSRPSTTPTASPSCRWAWSASPSAPPCCRCWPASCAPARPSRRWPTRTAPSSSACCSACRPRLALWLLAEPIIRVLFERGRFGPDDTLRAASALAAFAVGLPAFVLVKALTPGFFAREDTRTPLYIAHRRHRLQHRPQCRLPLRHRPRPGRHRARLLAVGLAERGDAGDGAAHGAASGSPTSVWCRASLRMVGATAGMGVALWARRGCWRPSLARADVAGAVALLGVCAAGRGRLWRAGRAAGRGAGCRSCAS